MFWLFCSNFKSWASLSNRFVNSFNVETIRKKKSSDAPVVQWDMRCDGGQKWNFAIACQSITVLFTLPPTILGIIFGFCWCSLNSMPIKMRVRSKVHFCVSSISFLVLLLAPVTLRIGPVQVDPEYGGGIQKIWNWLRNEKKWNPILIPSVGSQVFRTRTHIKNCERMGG